MDLQKEHFDSFIQNNFEILVKILNTQGYIIDEKDENGMSYSSVQLENMSQDIFNKLCNKFNISSDIYVSGTGGFYHKQGSAYYILYNETKYELSEAQKILDMYVKSF